MAKIVRDDGFMTEYNNINIEYPSQRQHHQKCIVIFCLYRSSFIVHVYNDGASAWLLGGGVFIICAFTRTHRTHWTMLWKILNRVAAAASASAAFFNLSLSLSLHPSASLSLFHTQTHSVHIHPYPFMYIRCLPSAIMSSLRRQHKYDKRAVIEYLMTWILIYESKRERITGE